MTATLQQALLAPDTQPQVVADCQTLIEQQLAGMSGISGTTVKLAYKTVHAFAPGHVTYLIETLLPRMTEELEPYWSDFGTSGGAEFGDYLAKRGDEVAEALLSVTDARRRPPSGRPSSRRTVPSAATRPSTLSRRSRRSARWCRSTWPDRRPPGRRAGHVPRERPGLTGAPVRYWAGLPVTCPGRA